MYTIYSARACQTIETKKGLRFKWFNSPWFDTKEKAKSHIDWYIAKHPKFKYSHIHMQYVF